MRILLTVMLMISFYQPAFANVVVNGTRIIYHAASRETTVQLFNNGTSPALVQAWIDDGDINSTPETARVPFLLTPPVVKIAGGSGQQLLIKKLPSTLPADRESVFFLNVLDIPPVPENLAGKNTVQLAVRSRIKLFYRPQALAGRSDKAITQVQIKSAGNGFSISNPSRYFITLANIRDGKQKNLLRDAIMLSPFATQQVASATAALPGKSYYLLYVDDLGAYKTQAVTSQ